MKHVGSRKSIRWLRIAGLLLACSVWPANKALAQAPIVIDGEGGLLLFATATTGTASFAIDRNRPRR